MIRLNFEKKTNLSAETFASNIFFLFYYFNFLASSSQVVKKSCDFLKPNFVMVSAAANEVSYF